MQSQFLFEHDTLDSDTTAHVRKRIESGQSCLVSGWPGTGRTHAVRQAVNGAVWVDVSTGPVWFSRFVCDAARQLGGGTRVLEALAEQDEQAALMALDEAAQNVMLVVDNGERLIGIGGGGWDDPTAALHDAQASAVMNWLLERATQHPTILITSRRVVDWTSNAYSHRPPGSCTLKLRNGALGYRDWATIAKRLDNNPGGLALAALAVMLLSADAFALLVGDLEWDQADSRETIRRLADIISARMPSGWAKAFVVAEAFDGLERAFVVRQLASDADAFTAFEMFEKLGLAIEHTGRTSLHPMVRDLGLLARQPPAAFEVLFASAAGALVGSVNEPTSLEPCDAERILRAHELYVALGDFGNAQRTCHLHVAGLIDIARRRSLANAWDESRRLYESILAMATRPTVGSRFTATTISYLRHYRAYNGRRAETVVAADALADYRAAVELWPENALWRSRLTSLLIEVGDLDLAMQAVSEAYVYVQEHPRRDTLLRLRPAQTALRAGLPLLALELVAALDEQALREDSEGLGRRDALLVELERGVEVDELPFYDGRLVLRHPSLLRVRLLAGGVWWAELRDLNATYRAASPLESVRLMAQGLATELRSLAGTPTHHLDDDQVRRKGLLIGKVDLVNSDMGLSFAEDRWLLGAVTDDGKFLPRQRELGDLEIAPDARPSARTGLFFGHVAVGRDGLPVGPVDRVEQAGRGKSLRALLEAARNLASEGAK